MINYFQIRTPELALQNYVKYFWVSTGSVKNIDSNVSCIFPDGLCHLLYIFKGSVIEVETGIRFKEGDIIIIGPKESISRYRNENELGVFGTCLYPYVLPILTSFSGISLLNITLEATLFDFVSSLETLFHSSRSNNQRVEIISSYLIKMIGSVRNVDEDILLAIRNMYSSPNPNVSDIAMSSRFSSRHFLRKFKDYTGFTPKKLQRVIRLKASVFDIKPKKLTELALEFGYFDQAHFVNDFKKISGGISPKDYFKRQEELEWRTVISFVSSFDEKLF